ncbi:MAG: dihydropteroate synthase [Prevotellaceae bacterium]|jgi:dihydropteroate synthase|nr:dihydropteroate synthase [Prevotellaceae bacterium]
MAKNIVLRGNFFDFSEPIAMAIINITPNSFFAESRCNEEKAIVEHAEKAISDGAKILDIGGYSTRPNADFVSEDEEKQRVSYALNIIRKKFPDVIISVDTFRAKVAEMAVNQYDADIINDISGGMLDEKMFETVAKINRPYILMHTRGTPQEMQNLTDYDDLVADILKYFAEKIEKLRNLGFTSDIILDLGFGFAKTTEQNYLLMRNIKAFECFNAPMLVGVSRKSMINNVLGTTPATALNGTTVLNTFALLNGADILRIHDVKEAVEAIKIISKFNFLSNAK